MVDPKKIDIPKEISIAMNSPTNNLSLRPFLIIYFNIDFIRKI